MRVSKVLLTSAFSKEVMNKLILKYWRPLINELHCYTDVVQFLIPCWLNKTPLNKTFTKRDIYLVFYSINVSVMVTPSWFFILQLNRHVPCTRYLALAFKQCNGRAGPSMTDMFTYFSLWLLAVPGVSSHPGCLR